MKSISSNAKIMKQNSPKKAKTVKNAESKSPKKSVKKKQLQSVKGLSKKRSPKSLKTLKTSSESTASPVMKPNSHVKGRFEKKGSGSSLNDQKSQFIKKKERKLARKSQSNNFELSQKSKKLWEKIRRLDCTKTQQVALCQELYNLVKDKIKELLMAHDTSRVIECLFVLGSLTIRNNLYDAVKDHFPLLMKSKYAKFFLIKILKCGTKPQKDAIIKSMYGNIKNLIRHSEAVNVVEYAYNEYANAQQRAHLTEELYGPQFALFKDPEVKSLADILTKQPSQRDTILSNMKENLNAIVNKPVMQHSIIHHALLEYLTHASTSDRTEMIAAIRESLVSILHTKDGSRIGMQCIWHGTVKDRKIIIKSMKSHVAKICMEEHGHMVLLAVFDTVDDTKLIRVSIIEEMMKSALDLAFHQHGRKVLLYLIAPRDPKHVHPDVIKILNTGSNNETSKKDPQVRSKELLLAASSSLLQLVTKNMEKMISCPSAIFIVQSVLINCVGDKRPAYEALAKLAETPVTAGDNEKQYIIENAAFHMLLKRLIQNDKAKSEEPDSVLFSSVLLEVIPSPTLTSWIHCNRGAFTLLFLLETDVIAITSKVKTILQPLTKELSKKKFKGAELLQSKLVA